MGEGEERETVSSLLRYYVFERATAKRGDSSGRFGSNLYHEGHEGNTFAIAFASRVRCLLTRPLFDEALAHAVNEVGVGGSLSAGAHVGGDLPAMIGGVQDYVG